jgi:hypothetical protein
VKIYENICVFTGFLIRSLKNRCYRFLTGIQYNMLWGGCPNSLGILIDFFYQFNTKCSGGGGPNYIGILVDSYEEFNAKCFGGGSPNSIRTIIDTY